MWHSPYHQIPVSPSLALFRPLTYGQRYLSCLDPMCIATYEVKTSLRATPTYLGTFVCVHTCVCLFTHMHTKIEMNVYNMCVCTCKTWRRRRVSEDKEREEDARKQVSHPPLCQQLFLLSSGKQPLFTECKGPTSLHPKAPLLHSACHIHQREAPRYS